MRIVMSFTIFIKSFIFKNFVRDTTTVVQVSDDTHGPLDSIEIFLFSIENVNFG